MQNIQNALPMAVVLVAASLVLGDDAEPNPATAPLVSLLELVVDADAEAAARCLGILTEKAQSGELPAEQLARLGPRLEEILERPLADRDAPLHFESVLLAASWKNEGAVTELRRIAASEKETQSRRVQALAALLSAGDESALAVADEMLGQAAGRADAELAELFAVLARSRDDGVAEIVLKHYAALDDELKPKAIELLTARTAWSLSLLEAIGRGDIPSSALNANQIRKLLASGSEELRAAVTRTWGTVRSERNPEREKVVTEMRALLTAAAGDPRRGRPIYDRICGQCHKLHGKGQDVGPDITANGRASFDQLLSNVFDPSLVIGADYQARIIITADGRVLSGLVVEEGPARVVLKQQGGKLETIAATEIDEMQVSRLSLMPEGLEKQLAPQELADLFALLCLDHPPDDADAKWIPGSPTFRVQPE